MIKDPFMIRAQVPDFDLISAGYRAASNNSRARWAHLLDLPYGPSASERLDLFFPPARDKNRPVHLFIHGGYWRANVKDDYAFVASTICGAGGIAAIAEYGKLPTLRMEMLVTQVRRAASWLRSNAESFGGDSDQLSASGHSAGAHLAYYLVARSPSEPAASSVPIRSLLLVSGIYDLRPIASSFLQREIALTSNEVAAWSPLTSLLEQETAITIAVGERETEPFRKDAIALAEKCSAMADHELILDRDHMTIMRDLGKAESDIGKLLQRSVDSPLQRDAAVGK